MVTISEKLCKLRGKHKVTNQQLADMTGIPIGTISGIMSGQVHSPSYANVCAILTALGEDIEQFNAGEDSPATEHSAHAQALQQAATVAAQAAMLEARDESIEHCKARVEHYKDRVSALDTELQLERKRVGRLQTVLVALIVAIIALAAIYIWDVRNLHSGLTAYFNS